MLKLTSIFRLACQQLLNFCGHSHPSDVVWGCDGGCCALAIIDDVLLEPPEISNQVEGSILLWNRDDTYLLALEWVRSVRKRDRAIGLRVHELLEVIFRDVVA